MNDFDDRDEWADGQGGSFSDGDPGAHEELGDPIMELQELREDVSSGFMARVLSALQRRSLVGNLATMAWTASAQALLEFLEMIFSVFSPGEPQKKEGRTNG